VVGVAGEAVGPEREHGVRANLVEEPGEAAYGAFRIGIGAAPVLVPEPQVLADAQDAQRAFELPVRSQAVAARPSGVVSAPPASPRVAVTATTRCPRSTSAAAVPPLR
jgi:hypothetical protein